MRKAIVTVQQVPEMVDIEVNVPDGEIDLDAICAMAEGRAMLPAPKKCAAYVAIVDDCDVVAAFDDDVDDFHELLGKCHECGRRLWVGQNNYWLDGNGDIYCFECAVKAVAAAVTEG